MSRFPPSRVCATRQVRAIRLTQARRGPRGKLHYEEEVRLDEEFGLITPPCPYFPSDLAISGGLGSVGPRSIASLNSASATARIRMSCVVARTLVPCASWIRPLSVTPGASERLIPFSSEPTELSDHGRIGQARTVAQEVADVHALEPSEALHQHLRGAHVVVEIGHVDLMVNRIEARGPGEVEPAAQAARERHPERDASAADAGELTSADLDAMALAHDAATHQSTSQQGGRDRVAARRLDDDVRAASDLAGLLNRGSGETGPSLRPVTTRGDAIIRSRAMTVSPTAPTDPSRAAYGLISRYTPSVSQIGRWSLSHSWTNLGRTGHRDDRLVELLQRCVRACDGSLRSRGR